MSGNAMARILGLQTLIIFAFDFTSSLIVARLLSPHEIGAYSIALGANVIAQTLRNAGVNMFLVATPELDEAKVRTTLGIAMLSSFTLAAIVFLAAPFVADFYAEPVIANVLRIISLSYLISPFMVLAHGLLSRALCFKELLIAAVSGSASCAALTIYLAVGGWGSVSMAWGGLLGSTISLMVMIAFRPPHFLYRPALSQWRLVTAFSGWALGGVLLGQLGARLNELFVGRALGIAPAAFLDRAEMLPRTLWSYASPPVLSLLTPLIAHELRTGVNSRGTLLLRMRLFGCLFSPVLIGIGTQSAPILIGLFGPQWHASIAPAPWLCIAAAIIGQFVVLNASLTGLGETRALFMLGLAEQSARVAMLILLCWTRIEWVAMGSVGVAIVYALAAIKVGTRLKLFTVREVLSSLVPAIAICSVVAVVGSAIDLARGGGIPPHPLLAVVEAAAILAVVWVVAVSLVQPAVIRAMWRLVRH
jgi:O-antigen/teichoic acid export membrane protein